LEYQSELFIKPFQFNNEQSAEFYDLLNSLFLYVKDIFVERASMTKARFIEICQEINYPPECIERTWADRPDWINEPQCREDHLKEVLALVVEAIDLDLLEFLRDLVYKEAVKLKAGEN
jgi:hypothetical protein